MYLGYLNGTHIGGSNNQQVYGNFEGPISLRIVHVWVGNIITPDASEKKPSKKSSPIKTMRAAQAPQQSHTPKKTSKEVVFIDFWVSPRNFSGNDPIWRKRICFNWVGKNHQLVITMKVQGRIEEACKEDL